MLWEFVKFYWQLLASCWKPAWLDSQQPDSSHFHRRRYTVEYRKKRRLVRDLWLGVGLLMLCFPIAAVFVGVGLFTTFLSFMILDETS